MPITKQSPTVAFLLESFGITVLASSPLKGQVQKDFDKRRHLLMSSLTPEERVSVLKMRDAVVELAKKLVRCNDVAQIEATHGYLVALNAGEVMIAVPDGEGQLTGYSPNL